MATNSGGARRGAGRPRGTVADSRRRFHELWFGVVTLEEHKAIIRQIVEAAQSGDKDAQRIYLERVEGKVSQSLELRADPERPLVVRVRERGDPDAGL